ncbi:MAG TPA: hypothetical protein VIV40_20455 [Kofleriaceae bacterium]
MKALAILMLGAATAHAQPDFDGGAQLHYELEGLHDVEHDAMDVPTVRDSVLASARLHGFIGTKRIGFHIGLDLGAGGTIDGGGFAYDVALFPAGIALRFFETSFITLGAGVGASGATGTLDDAATFPVEARFELGRGIRVLGRARATFLAASDSRQDGAQFADELEAMLAVRIGRAYTDWGFPTGNGYFVGATYREALGAKFAGIVIGYSIDMGSPRSEIRHESSCEDCE